MKINDHLRGRIRNYMEDNGLTVAEFAEIMEVTPASVSRWLTGKTQQIRASHSLLLTRTLGANAITLCSPPGTAAPPAVHSPPVVPLKVITPAKAAEYTPALQPLAKFLAPVGRTEHFLDVPRSRFCIELTDPLPDCPLLPPGALLVIAADRHPEEGDIVASRLEDGLVLLKRYSNDNGHITLEGLCGHHRSFHIDSEKHPGRIIWIYPIASVMVSLGEQ